MEFITHLSNIKLKDLIDLIELMNMTQEIYIIQTNIYNYNRALDMLSCSLPTL